MVILGLLLCRAMSVPAPLPTPALTEDWVACALLLLGWSRGGKPVADTVNHDASEEAGKLISGPPPLRPTCSRRTDPTCRDGYCSKQITRLTRVVALLTLQWFRASRAQQGWGS